MPFAAGRVSSDDIVASPAVVVVIEAIAPSLQTHIDPAHGAVTPTNDYEHTWACRLWSVEIGPNV